MLIHEQKLKVAKSGVDLTNLFSYNRLFKCENAWKIQKEKERTKPCKWF